ncbi:hypothetical protein Tsubulata_039833 [Turnera subulata]|uniref:Disease resistance N-terminal domain-containing protein n=1 Tax=Turnera subulata TaxID=218843 RepID=A0A9Q0JGG6_9ROSI|nr:hypothetical protein Tsubulata_039833 [Turnera subulata]
MGEFVLTFVVEELLRKLASLALERIGLALGLKGKLQKLNDSLTFIRAVLHDALERQAREDSVKIWLRKLRDVAYEAEDVLDEFGYEVLRQKVEGSTPSKKVINFFSASSNPIVFRLHMGKKFKKINDELAEIKDDAVGFGLISAFLNACCLTTYALHCRCQSILGSWHDPRLSGEPLKLAFPRLLSLSLSKNSTVCEMGCWSSSV